MLGLQQMCMMTHRRKEEKQFMLVIAKVGAEAIILNKEKVLWAIISQKCRMVGEKAIAQNKVQAFLHRH